jgi:hypothetical protein
VGHRRRRPRAGEHDRLTPASPAEPAPFKDPSNATPDACTPFVEAARRELITKIPRRDDFSPDTFAEDLCVTTPRGTWTIEYTAVTAKTEPPPSDLMAPPVHIYAPWRTLHISAAGVRAVAPGGTLYIAGYSAQFADLSDAFDFDGDGDDEVLLRTGYERWDERERSGQLLTARGGSIAPYPRAAGINIQFMDDIDEDGRPDLLTFGPYVPESTSCGPEPNSQQYVYLAAHSLLGGGFSMTDAEAIAYAKRACPEKPRAIEIDKLGANSMLDVRCARLWGMSSQDAVKAIQKACSGQLEQCGQHGKGDCLHFDALMAWATATPSIRLAP